MKASHELRLLTAFRVHPVLTFDEIREVLGGVSEATARRALREIPYRSSYNHNGRYKSRRHSRRGNKGLTSRVLKVLQNCIRSVDALWIPCLWVFISSIRDSLHPGPEQISTKGHPYPIILMALLILGAIILYARRFNLSVFIKENKLVVLLYCWMRGSSPGIFFYFLVVA